MDETSLNAKRGIEGLSTFQSAFAHDLAYCPNESNFFLIEIQYMQG